MPAHGRRCCRWRANTNYYSKVPRESSGAEASVRGDDPEWRVSPAYMMLSTGLRNRVLDPQLERAHHEG